MELHAVVQGDAGGEDHGLRVVAVDVQDGGVDDLGDVGAVVGGAGVQGVGGGEADLVVDDHVHRAAGGVAGGLRHVQAFHDHALSGKGGVAVDQYGQDFVALGVAAALLAGLHRALHHRVGDLQM